MSVFNNIFIKLFSFTFGKVKYQGLYKKLYSLSLRGLNYGIVDSGEESVIKIIKKKFEKQDGIVLFDIGANIGGYTKSLLKHFEFENSIYCFEPFDSTFKTLSINLLGTKVNLNKLGLGRENERLKFYRNRENPTLASGFKRTSEDVEELVIIQTLDKFCETHKIEKIHFMKIDVEGFEMNVLLGAKKMLDANKILSFQFEFGGTQVAAGTFFKDFWDLLSPNFKLYRVLNNGLEEISKYNFRLENFSYANYLAVLK